jgi:adenylate cyclase
LVPDAGGDEIPLVRPVIVVGRRETCDICMRFTNVSGKHCELAFRAGKWWIQDLGSQNGVRVNGYRVKTAILNPGDRISIARHKYSIDYAPTAGPAHGS